MTKLPDQPKKSAADMAHTIVKAAVSAVPVVGSPAAELLSFIFGPPLEKRREAWLNQLAEAVRDVRTRNANFTPEVLSEDPAFVTTALLASEIAIRTHQEEKLAALRNAVVNAALNKTIEQDLRSLFLNFVDVLTPSHIAILRFNENSFGYPADWREQFLATPAARAASDQMVNELVQRGLMEDTRPFAARGRPTPEALIRFQLTVTSLGVQFLKFISRDTQ